MGQERSREGTGAVQPNGECTEIASNRVFEEDPTGIKIRASRRIPRARCCADTVDTRSDCERLTRLCFGKARKLPTCKNSAECASGPGGRKPRHFINVMHDKPVRTIED